MIDKMQPMVSIIVPVYNVARYVEKCILSATAQTHRNIEVIVINDGSTDNCGEILSALAKKDDRIILINQKNAGVSSARNAGLNIARGEYVIFVDGDDWLSEDCVEYMLKIVKKTKSEMAISINNFTTRDTQQITNDKINTWSATEAVCRFLYPGIPIGSWNKIYKRSFLIKNDLRFQEDMFMGEGMRFITDVAQRASHVGVGRRKVYWYRLNNTQSATTIPSVKHGLAALDAIKSIRANLTVKNNDILRAIHYHIWMNNFYILRILLASKIKNSHKELYRSSIKNLRSNGIRRIVESDVSLPVRIKMLGIVLFPRILAKVINAQKARGISHDKTA